MNKATKAIVVYFMVTLVVVSLPHKQINTESKDVVTKENIIIERTSFKEEDTKTVLIEPKVKSIKYKEVTLIATFYTSLPDESSGTGITASGKKVSEGMIAVNEALPFGTKIITEEFGTLTVEDRGNKRFFPYINDTKYKIDIFVEQNKNETDKEYKKRAKAMGVQKIKGKILIEGG